MAGVRRGILLIIALVVTLRAATCFVGAAGSGATWATILRPTDQALSHLIRQGFSWHARDPNGVKHIETRRQAMVASYLKSTLEAIFNGCEVTLDRLGDEDIQGRLRIDDIIMSRGCRAAYIHVAASGDKLEQRQSFVWLQRNKGRLKTALAKRWRTRRGVPQVYFIESKWDEWDSKFRKAREYPELNDPDPYQFFPNWTPKFMEKSPALRKLAKDDRVEKIRDSMGLGDETKPYPKWGYPQ